MMAFALVTVVSASLKVEGASTCPTPAQVQAKLNELLPAQSSSGHLALIEPSSGGVRIVLRNGSGAELAKKDFEKRTACAALAEIAAVVLAAWETEFAERVPEPIQELPARVALKPRPLSAEPRVEEAPPPRPSAPSPQGQFEAGAAALVSFPGGVAAGIALHGAYLFGENPLGIELMANVATPRDLLIGSGHAYWHRWSVGIGPRVRLLKARLDLDAYAHLLGALLTLRGSGFAENSTVIDAEPGVSAGLRASLSGSRWRPWLGLGAVFWPKVHAVNILTLGDPTGTPRAVEKLPRFEILLSLGISFRTL